MQEKNLAGDDIRRCQHWEWTQGVGLYGLWKLFASTREQKYLDVLTKFYDAQLEIGFPALNVNTITPFLTMSYVGEYLQDEKYLAPCREAASWIMERFPRTQEGGFQHMTSDTLNDQELWDDTLFMTVLFLANMGRIEDKRGYIDEAQRQFLLHAKYLADEQTGLWYHGWTFNGCHNFAGAFWGRGNCWVTIAIPEFLQMVDCDAAVKELLTRVLCHQVDSLVKYQNENGMWHTLIDDPSSYVESSATCGFGYGIFAACAWACSLRHMNRPHGKRLNPSLPISATTAWCSRYPMARPWDVKPRTFISKLKSNPCHTVRLWQCCS